MGTILRTLNRLIVVLSPTNPNPVARAAWILAAPLLGMGLLAILRMLNIKYGGDYWPNTKRAATSNPPWTLLTSVLAAPTIYLTWLWRTLHKDRDIEQKQAEVDMAKREERSRRFAEAITLLSSASVEGRLGAVYSMESLALESSFDVRRIAETLCAFVRYHRSQEPSEYKAPSTLPGMIERRPGFRKGEDAHDGGDTRANAQDAIISAALRVIAQLDVGERVLDLRQARLPGIELEVGFSSMVDLSGANLQRAKLAGVSLRGANLTGVDLSNADLCGADISAADLSAANLSGATLHGANLGSADLGNANLRGAKLSRVEFGESHLKRISAVNSQLRRMRLIASAPEAKATRSRNAELKKSAALELVERKMIVAHQIVHGFGPVSLTGANLSEANLANADLRGVDLTSTGIQQAVYSAGTKLPADFDPVARGMRREDDG